MNASEAVEVYPMKKGRASKPAVPEDLRPDEYAATYAFGLGQNHPNPANPSTTIRYTLSEASEVQLAIYNVLGQPVRVLVNAFKVAGVHRVRWDGRDAYGREVTSGVYLYLLEAGQNVAVRKIVVVR